MPETGSTASGPERVRIFMFAPSVFLAVESPFALECPQPQGAATAPGDISSVIFTGEPATSQLSMIEGDIYDSVVLYFDNKPADSLADSTEGVFFLRHGAKGSGYSSLLQEGCLNGGFFVTGAVGPFSHFS